MALLALALAALATAAKAFGACVLAFLAVSLLPWLRDVWRTRHFPPFIPAPPFIGDFVELGTKGMHRLFADRAARYLPKYPAYRVFMGSQVWVVTADPESARRQLSRLIQRNRFVQVSPDETAIGGGRDLVSLSGERWRRMRLAWLPAFSPTSLARYAPLIDGYAQNLVAKIEPYSLSGDSVDVMPFIDATALDVVGTSAFGVRFNALASQQGAGGEGKKRQEQRADHADRNDADADHNDDDHDALEGKRLVNAVRTIFERASLVGSGYQALPIMFPLGTPLWRWLARHFPDENLRAMNAAQRVVAEASTALVRRQHRREDEEKEQQQQAAASNGGVPVVAARLAKGVLPGSFLSQLLRPAPVPRGGEAPLPLEKIDAVAQAGLFVVAGAETTSSAVACCVYALSTNPSAQRRLCAEIDAFFGEHGQDAPLTPEAIAAHFPYAEGAVKEALRYYTPVTNIPREVTALPESPDPHAWRSDLIVGAAKASSPHGGVSSPPPPLHPGIVVVAANYVYQRSSEFWPRAHEFLPERWVPEDRGGAASVLGASTPWAWTPFGGGPRRCVGLKFALLEAAIVIVRLFQSYSFEPAPGQKVPLPMKQTVTHHPDGGVHVVVKRREEAKQRQR